MRSRVVVLLAVLLLTLASCGGAVSVSPSPSVAASPFPATLSDFQNRSVTVPSRPERLVSIGPSITAFLFALGAGPRVVGVDDFSDEPAEAATREHVGGIKVNFEKVVALKPDLVFSVKFSDGTIEKLQAASLNVLVVDPQSRRSGRRSARALDPAASRRRQGEDGERRKSAPGIPRDRRLGPGEDLHGRARVVHQRSHRDRRRREHRGPRGVGVPAALRRGNLEDRPRDHRPRGGRVFPQAW